MIEKEMTCITCPIGCTLHVTQRDNGEVEVTGHTCARGKAYGIAEMTDPRRMVTSSVLVTDGQLPLVSVKTEKPVPKGKTKNVVEALRGIRLQAPVTIGDVICADVAGTGVSVVATRCVDRV